MASSPSPCAAPAKSGPDGGGGEDADSGIVNQVVNDPL